MRKDSAGRGASPLSAAQPRVPEGVSPVEEWRRCGQHPPAIGHPNCIQGSTKFTQKQVYYMIKGAGLLLLVPAFFLELATLAAIPLNAQRYVVDRAQPA